MSAATEVRSTDEHVTPAPHPVGRRVVLTLGTILPALLTVGALASLASGADDGIHRVHDLVHACWLGLLVAIPYALHWRRPQTRVALWQGLAVGAVLVPVGGAVAGVADPVFYVFFPLLAFFTWFTHPARATLLRSGPGLSPVLTPLSALGAVAAVLYAVDQLGLQRDLASDPHGEMTHYASQGIAALTMAAFAAAASFRRPGWQWAGGLAAVAAAAWGAMSVALPDHAGSLGRGAGLRLLAAAAVFVAALVWEQRRG
jgi:hypothetical protein